MPRMQPLPQHYMSYSTPLLPIPPDTFDKIEKDDPVWKQYVDTARDFDTAMIEEWNKFLDVILVFIALFIGVLASFVIETQKEFDPDPAKIANDLLLDIVKLLSNSSREGLHIPDKLPTDPDDLHAVIVSNALLFVSLAMSIGIAMTAMLAKLWLIRYISWVRTAGSSYDLAMRRQKAYSGIQEWKLHRVIDCLPIFVLIAVCLFGVFIHQTIYPRNLTLGYIVGVTFLLGLAFLVIASCSAAFISSSPFQSPFSRFLSWFFDLILPKDWKSSTSWRNIIGLSSLAIATLMTLIAAHNSSTYQLLIFVPIVGLFAAAAKPEEESIVNSKENSEETSPLFGPPQLVLIGGFTVFIPIAVVSYIDNPEKIHIRIIVSLISVFLCPIYGTWMRKVRVPNMLEAEAIAWLLESSQDPPLSLFKTAAGVATTTPRKVLLLSKSILSLFPHMIALRLRPTPGEHDNGELHMLLSCLVHLSDFPDAKWSLRSLMRNTASLKHPKLRDTSALPTLLKELSSNVDPRLSSAAEALLPRLVKREKSLKDSLLDCRALLITHN